VSPAEDKVLDVQLHRGTRAVPKKEVERDGYRFSVCICTRNRPEDLTVALRSIAESEYPVWQTVVSDDSTDDRTAELVTRKFPEATFVEGPRRGLCANRNVAVCAATGTHVVFIDDDAALGKTYLSEIVSAFERVLPDKRDRTILTGLERCRGELVYPSDISFLGFQAKHYEATSRLRTFVMNASAFPIGLFEQQGFDENLVYGCDEVDFAVRSVARGFAIVLAPRAINDHYSSTLNRTEYRSFYAASRFYVTFKRYCYVEGKPLRAMLYAVVGPIHYAFTWARMGNMRVLRQLVPSIALALAYLKRYRSARTDRPTRRNDVH
jgi:glycosyltransferase involved in cell wall biosynthesis